MENKKTILIIGIDPFLIDFSTPEFAAFPGLTAEKVETGIKGAIRQLIELGFDAQLCWIDFGQTAIAVLEADLKKTSFNCILVGAGIRKPEANFLLFEKMINTIHEFAPKASICFNTNPTDTMDAVKRWL
jgi:hypothetical protein